MERWCSHCQCLTHISTVTLPLASLQPPPPPAWWRGRGRINSWASSPFWPGYLWGMLYTSHPPKIPRGLSSTCPQGSLADPAPELGLRTSLLSKILLRYLQPACPPTRLSLCLPRSGTPPGSTRVPSLCCGLGSGHGTHRIAPLSGNKWRPLKWGQANAPCLEAAGVESCRWAN